MQQLGVTRSVRRADHIVQTPDTFVRSPLAGLHGGSAIVHVGPAAGARFTMYTVEFEAGGRLEAGAEQRFVYVLEGEAAGDYSYYPAGRGALSFENAARVMVIEKAYQALDGLAPPEGFSGRGGSVAGQVLVDGVEVQELVAGGPAFDFAVNIMTYRPGASLGQVEVHIMEHGMLMLSGGGIYRLGENWYPVTEGDFIWMGPCCPQWFGALGKVPARYLIYKNWNRT